VYAVRAREPGDVRPVVDDDQRTEAMRQRDDRRRRFQKRTARGLLGANLQQACAAVQVRSREIDKWPAGAARGLGIENGRQRG